MQPVKLLCSWILIVKPQRDGKLGEIKQNFVSYTKLSFRIQPLLQRIKEKRSAVVCPVIDLISDKTMEYMGGDLGGTLVFSNTFDISAHKM